MRSGADAEAMDVRLRLSPAQLAVACVLPAAGSYVVGTWLGPRTVGIVLAVGALLVSLGVNLALGTDLHIADGTLSDARRSPLDRRDVLGAQIRRRAGVEVVQLRLTGDRRPLQLRAPVRAPWLPDAHFDAKLAVVQRWVDQGGAGPLPVVHVPIWPEWSTEVKHELTPAWNGIRARARRHRPAPAPVPAATAAATPAAAARTRPRPAPRPTPGPGPTPGATPAADARADAGTDPRRRRITGPPAAHPRIARPAPAHRRITGPAAAHPRPEARAPTPASLSSVTRVAEQTRPTAADLDLSPGEGPRGGRDTMIREALTDAVPAHGDNSAA